MKRRTSSIAAVLLVLSFSFSSYAIFGIGGNWSLDMSTKLDDALGEAAVFENLSLDISPFTPTLPGLPVAFQSSITGDDIPIIVDRTDFKSTPLNLGGKLYIDIIPVIDAIEISGNFYTFTYQSLLAFPDPAGPFTIKPDLSQADPQDFKTWVDVNYDTVRIGTNALGGDTVVPFAKLQFDATIRKTLIGLPPIVKILKVYAGGGPSLAFSTPILSGGMIYDVLGSRVDAVGTLSEFSLLFTDPAVQKEIAEYALKQLFTPHFGFHIVFGLQVKPPIMPLALYTDFKYTLGGKLDENVDLKLNSLTAQVGIALAF